MSQCEAMVRLGAGVDVPIACGPDDPIGNQE
jgi:hypothetical protein